MLAYDVLLSSMVGQVSSVPSVPILVRSMYPKGFILEVSIC